MCFDALINVQKSPREILKPESKARNQANVNALKNKNASLFNNY